MLDCKLHDVARLQLYEKLGGLLENRVSTYSKSKLCEILLYGEKPEMLEKYTHNKFIFLSVQKFIYTVHRYHFFNDPYDLWLSLQNISNFSLQNISVYFCYFLSTYPTDYTIWHWRFDNFDWQLDPFLSCISIYPQYWTAAYTGALSSLSQGNEMNRMNVVCCFQLYTYISLTLQYHLWSMSLLHQMISWP